MTALTAHPGWLFPAPSLPAILHRRSAQVIAALTALQLGLLYPLNCILHCVFQQQTIYYQSAPVLFVCDHYPDADQAAPTPSPPDRPAPQAFYQSLGPVEPAPILPPLRLMWLINQTSLAVLSRSEPPPTPPPRPPHF
ncbi:MAG: hypothetical protein RMJ54_18465 [Roseiflexaceae bacterium]|nr:hypothetical protein [Roseiflexaceae bacterium]